MDEDPCNDVTPPCPECGEFFLPCDCGKPIETVAQLERALGSLGDVQLTVRRHRHGEKWLASITGSASTHSHANRVVRKLRPSMAAACSDAILEWWRS